MEQLITSAVSFSRTEFKKEVKTQLAIQNELLRDLSVSSSYQGDTQLGVFLERVSMELERLQAFCFFLIGQQTGAEKGGGRNIAGVVHITQATATYFLF